MGDGSTALTSLVVIALTLLGGALGSFANVVIYRVPEGKSVVSPPSACPRCGSPIRPWHNVPVVGWLWLRGRCADCGEPISGRYPLVELAMALGFGVIGGLVGVDARTPLLLVLFFFSVVLSLTDVDVRRLPNRIVLAFAIAAVPCVGLVAWDGEWGAVVLRALAGATGMVVVYGGAFLAYPRGMGLGDVKLAPVLGLVLGAVGWPALLVGGFAAFVWGTIVGVLAMARSRRTRGVAIPFGPSMFLGAWTGVLLGPAAADIYLRAMGLT